MTSVSQRMNLDESVPYLPISGTAHTTTCVHVRSATTLFYRIYESEDRITVHLGEGSGEAVLFLDRADTKRLIQLLVEAALLLMEANQPGYSSS